MANESEPQLPPLDEWQTVCAALETANTFRVVCRHCLPPFIRVLSLYRPQWTLQCTLTSGIMHWSLPVINNRIAQLTVCRVVLC